MITLPENYRNERGCIQWPLIIDWIIQEAKGGRSYTSISEEVGISRKNMASTLVWYRDKGYDIPKSVKGPHRVRITERIAHGGGYHYHQKRIDGKWVTISRVEEYQRKLLKTPKKSKGRKKPQQKIKIIKAVPVKPVGRPARKVTKNEIERVAREKKRAAEVLPTRVETRQMKSVKVASGTWIQAPVDTPDYIVKQQWEVKYKKV